MFLSKYRNPDFSLKNKQRDIVVLMEFIDKNLVFKLKGAPIYLDLQYKDMGQLFVQESKNPEKYSILISKPTETLSLNLPYVSNISYHEYYPFLMLHTGANRKISLRSANVQSMYVTESEHRGKMNLTIDYEMYSPDKDVLQFFGIVTSTWIKIRLRFRNYREKMISQLYDLLNPGLHEKDGKERCKDCRALKNRVKTSDALLFELEEICPSCLNGLSTKIGQIKRQVESLAANFDQHTKNHDSLIEKIDSTIVSSIKMQDDTSKLYLGYLKSKLMISTTKFHNLGLQAMGQIFELISDYEYLQNLNLPPEFDEDVENSLINGFVRNKRHSEALKVAEIGYDLNRKANNTFKMAKSLNRMSELYLALNQYDDAEECAEESYNLHVKNRFSGKSLERSAEILTRIYRIKNREDKIQNVKLHRFFKD